MNLSIKSISRLSTLSLALSSATLVSVLWINWQIAVHYNSLGIKDQRLFGIIEFFRYGYKYFLLLPGCGAFVLAIWAFKRSEPKQLRLFAIFTALIAIASVFIEYWVFISVTKTLPTD